MNQMGLAFEEQVPSDPAAPARLNDRQLEILICLMADLLLAVSQKDHRDGDVAMEASGENDG